ncbi:MAG: MFS transporter, partial [Actinomycetota bacterium]
WWRCGTSSCSPSSPARPRVMAARTVALIANVVPEEHLLNAVALGGISQHGSRVIGPLFGAAFLALLGPGSVFVVSAVLLSLSLIEAIRLRHRPAPRTAPSTAGAAGPGGAVEPFDDGAAAVIGRLVGDLAGAGRYVRADRRLLTVIILVGAHCSLTMAFDSMMPILAERVGGSSTLYSAILIGLGSGAIVGTLTVSQLQRDRNRGAVFTAVAFGSGLAMVIMGTATTPVAVVAGAVLAGLTQASYMTMSAALIQKIVSDEFRGRVMSLYIMIAAGHMAILNLGFGRAADDIDVRLLLVVPGLAWIGVLVASLAVVPELRWLVARGRFVSMRIAGAT